MVTDTQAGGISLSGLPPKNHKPTHESGAEVRPGSKVAFSAIMDESDSEDVEGGAPMTPTSDETGPETAPSDGEQTTTEETEGSAASGDPDTKRIEPRGAEESGVREGLPATSDRTAGRASMGKGMAGHTVMTANGAGTDGTAGADQAFARGIGEGGRPLASPGDATVSAKPGVVESRAETKAVPVAERPPQTGVGPLSAPPDGVRSKPGRAAAGHGPSVPLSAIAPALAGAAEGASRDAPLLPGGRSRSGAVFSLPTLSMPESAKLSGEGTSPGRPNGAAVTQAFSLPGVTYFGATPVTGGSGLSHFGPLPRSEHALTSDAGSTGPDARFPGHHASATSLAAPAAPYRQDLPHQIAVQIAAAVEKGKAGTQKNIDLSLNPEELGRVRLRLNPSEGGLNVVIVAERSETLDLLRRNIDTLAREFLEIGYEGASFDFAGEQQEQTDGHGSIPLPPVPDGPGTAPAIQTGETHVLALGDRLDIRL